eukprot:TRINITY_DN5974_c1_g2_i2.p1 TRINITY_DN5974_c1_g2~~TRINITY_DN5974_c1_g2_i2.p1  ORF type:complete len:667 (+),score=145.68 TRINITY_DN5974_c1_g2_i2:73-2073(+)
MSFYAGSKTPTTSTPAATPRRKGNNGAEEEAVQYSVRVLLSLENGDQRFVPLYDSQRNEENPMRHPDELSVQAIMQMVHGSLPLRLDKAFTKVHWTHTAALSQIMVTKLFKCTFARKLVDQRGTSVKNRGSTSSLSSSYGSTDNLFQCKTTFAVAVLVTLYGQAGTEIKINTTPNAPSTPKCESYLNRSQLSRSLAGLQSLGDTHSAFDDATMYTRNNTEGLFTDSDGYMPDLSTFASNGRPKQREGIIEIIQSHFPFLNQLVEGVMDKATEALRSYVSNTAGHVFMDAQARIRPHDLLTCPVLQESFEYLRTTIASFLFPTYLLQEKQRSSLSSSSSILPYVSRYRKPADFQLLCTVVTAALRYHQGWLRMDSEGVNKLSMCRFLVHGTDAALIKAMLVVLSFFVRCGLVNHSCAPLPSTVFPPSLDCTQDSLDSSPSSSPKKVRSECECTDFTCVAAAVAVVASVCGVRVWEVEGTFTSVLTMSPVPSSTYCYGALAKVLQAPFLLLGVEKDNVSEEEVACFVSTEAPEWMSCHKDDGCVVVDVTRKTCVLHKDSRCEVQLSSSSVKHYLKASLDCYSVGVPSADCEESLQIGLSEIISMSTCISSALVDLPPNSSLEDVRSTLLGIPQSDMCLLIATATALNPQIEVSCREGKTVCGGARLIF